MRAFAIGFVLLGLSQASQAAHQQELIPVIREIHSTVGPSLTRWNTYVQLAKYDQVPYVSLVQVAELLNGHLKWHTVAKKVDFSVHGQKVQFVYYSRQAWINGTPVRLEHETVKNEDGFWVPVSFFASETFFDTIRAKLLWPPPQEEEQEKKEEKRIAAKPRPVAAAPSPTVAHAIKRIIIDPGHGGKDPGATGPRGTQEKTVNLRIAQELADLLRDSYGYEVLLTRMDDSFVPLEERSNVANKLNGDLFISLHCNASALSSQRGFEVYFLSEKASDSSAEAAAKLENAVLALENKQVPSPSRVKSVLRSLEKTAYINEASAVGSLMEKRLAERLSVKSLGVKQAAFHVLRGADMPAVLIEMGFISNAKEEKLLMQEDFIMKVTEGLAAGIVAYDLRKQKERG